MFFLECSRMILDPQNTLQNYDSWLCQTIVYYIPWKTNLAILQIFESASDMYLHIQLYRILPGIRPNTSVTPNSSWSLQDPNSRCHSAGRHCMPLSRKTLWTGPHGGQVTKFISRDCYQIKQLKERHSTVVVSFRPQPWTDPHQGCPADPQARRRRSISFFCQVQLQHLNITEQYAKIWFTWHQGSLQRADCRAIEG